MIGAARDTIKGFRSSMTPRRRLVSLELQKKGECVMKQVAKSRRNGAQRAMKEEQRTMGKLLVERKFLERDVSGAVVDWCTLRWKLVGS